MMTRKQYVRRVTELIIAIYTSEQAKGREIKKGQMGNSMRYSRDHAKEVIGQFGTYEAAWEALKPAREAFGVK